MFWVIQNNLYNEYGYTVLIDTLDRLNIQYVDVKVVPFFDILAPVDFDSHSYQKEIDKSIEPIIDDTGLVMVCGSLTLAKIAKQIGWVPGSFINDNFHYNEWKKAYGENLLNFDSVVGYLNTIKLTWDEFFIRPCEDTKEFSGMVLTKDQLYACQNGLIVEGIQYCDSNPLVIAAPLREIYNEYRFFVIDGQIITYSQYKLGNKIVHSPYVDEEIIKFTQKMVDNWQPARAFVIDIALIPEGLKVIEINNFNSAGFYASDVNKIVGAIENMKFNIR